MKLLYMLLPPKYPNIYEYFEITNQVLKYFRVQVHNLLLPSKYSTAFSKKCLSCSSRSTLSKCWGASILKRKKNICCSTESTQHEQVFGLTLVRHAIKTIITCLFGITLVRRCFVILPMPAPQSRALALPGPPSTLSKVCR